MPVPLGRAALCGASVVQSASCAGARRPTAPVPGTADGKCLRVGTLGSVKIAFTREEKVNGISCDDKFLNKAKIVGDLKTKAVSPVELIEAVE